jgi:hypothetical protein
VLGREPRRLQPKPKAAGPRPLAAVPAPNTPATGVSPAVPPSTGDPVVGQQVPPLPPPIEVRPAPNVIARPPKPKAQPPLLLTPPAQGTSQQTY